MADHSIKSSPIHRLGFHYFPDSNHYRESDLHTWLPKMRSLGAYWLTLVAPPHRAIPEYFLRGLLDEGIQPTLHFSLPLSLPLDIEELCLIFETYARWGIRYVSLFDRPNTRLSWPATTWTQADLVERFLDIYLPLADAILNAGLIPVFPPLEPGGDYWDTAFLRAALGGIRRRGYHNLLSNLVLGAYGWIDDHHLSWGAGGPERWPGARPYHTPQGQEDQRGFYIFKWYLAISQAVLGKPRPVILMKTGFRSMDRLTASTSISGHNQKIFQSLLRLISGEPLHLIEDPCCEVPNAGSRYEEIPPELLACNLWLLSASEDSPYRHQAWFHPDGTPLPVVRSLLTQRAKASEYENATAGPQPNPPPESPPETTAQTMPGLSSIVSQPNQTIKHYLLLPIYEWGVAEWHLDVIRPYVKKHRPTIGFSLAEASQASHVTIIGGENSFPNYVIEQLRSSGCKVERITGDGTQIATKLASL